MSDDQKKDKPAKNLTRKLIDDHLVEGEATPGQEIGLRIDQTLTQDATGTLAMLAYEAMGGGRVRTDVSVQYVDHNLLQTDYRNADDHVFLRSACKRYGVWFSKPGNGVSHPVHMERFGVPGTTLLGSDSHTPAAGALGMLAMGAGGLDVAAAMAGEPYFTTMPEVFGVKLTGKLPDWVSAKDVILEMLRRHGVRGGVGRVVEYYGPGLVSLSAMDRHVIANMGTELGATTTVFPSDDVTRAFLQQQKREGAWRELIADDCCEYELTDEIDLSSLVPLMARPSSPGNVVPVKEDAGKEIYQAYIGSSANPGLRDFAVPAQMVKYMQVNDAVSFDINPTSRQILGNLSEMGHLSSLIKSGARLHQAGCNGCIGMGQAPATGRISLRTVPRNFPGRSGTREDQVYLCSPETATASALTGVVTDPRDLEMPYPEFEEPQEVSVNTEMLMAPADEQSSRDIELQKGPNIKTLPTFDSFPDHLDLPVLLRVGDDISTDEIMPAGQRVLPYRSNIEKMSDFVFVDVDESFTERARQTTDSGGFAIVAGNNYGQGSSREHAALVPRYLGLRLVVANSFARIHRKNLINYGVLPLLVSNGGKLDTVDTDARIELTGLHDFLRDGDQIKINVAGKDRSITCRHDLSERERRIVAQGGLFNVIRSKGER
ncbi:aconitate hydratase [candidate division GN15 bacterium]|nr:aconitate hydratase [candidate division GN15 bacterium]